MKLILLLTTLALAIAPLTSGQAQETKTPEPAAKNSSKMKVMQNFRIRVSLDADGEEPVEALVTDALGDFSVKLIEPDLEFEGKIDKISGHFARLHYEVTWREARESVRQELNGEINSRIDHLEGGFSGSAWLPVGQPITAVTSKTHSVRLTLIDIGSLDEKPKDEEKEVEAKKDEKPKETKKKSLFGR
ncbi:MAG: hypothetical protein AAF514_23785 [Verrucomicrobiota bacterium]